MAKVHFFRPFDEISGKREVEIEQVHPILVQDLLKILATKIPTFQSYLKKEGDKVTNFFVLLVRGEEILKLNDQVYEKDVIKILPPVSGG